MWAHATPPGLRAPQASSDVTPGVFLRVDSVETCGETPHADWVMCPITMMIPYEAIRFGQS